MYKYGKMIKIYIYNHRNMDSFIKERLEDFLKYETNYFTIFYFLIMVFAILCVVAYVILGKKRIFHSEEEYRVMDMPQEQLRICLKLSKA